MNTFRTDFKNMKYREKPGEYNECSYTSICFLAKKSLTKNAMWEDMLSWYKVLSKHSFGLF